MKPAAADGWTFRPYDLALRTPYRWAHGAQERRRGLLVALRRGAHAGGGECAPPPHEAVDGAALAAEAARLVRGLDPLSPRFLTALDARHPAPRLRCGLATAHLDLVARRAGLALADHLAEAIGLGRAAHSEVPVNALIVATGAHEAGGAAEAARAAMAAGIRTLKIKCSDDRRADVARVRAIHEATPEARLRLDANGAWDTAWAADHLADLRDAAGGRIEYVEQPLPADELEALATLRRGTDIRVALDEPVTGPTAVQEILAAGAADVLVLKPQRLGGPDRAALLVRMVEAAGLEAVVTNSLETAVGVTAALHVACLLPAPVPACGLATSGLLAEDVAAAPPVRDGRMRRPEEPGLGLDGWPDDGPEEAVHGA